jgi:DNA repair protein RecO (recombination protein O)
MAQAQAAEFCGIVFFRKNYRERDMLVKILTDNFGFKMFFIRGARKRGFRLGSALLPFTTANYSGAINPAGLSFINAARDVTHYRHLLEDIELNAYAAYILELAAAAFGDSRPLGSWFVQLRQALVLIEQQVDPQIITNIIEVRLLGFFGVQPDLQDCVICHQKTGDFDFSESYGGLLCPRHYHLDPHRLQLDQRTIYFLRFFSQVDLRRLHSIKVKDQTKVKLRQALDQIYDNEVGLNLKARHFLEEMKIWPKD